MTVIKSCFLLLLLITLCQFANIIYFRKTTNSLATTFLRRSSLDQFHDFNPDLYTYPTKECRQLVPECIPKQDLLHQYGVAYPHVNKYTQTECCANHKLNRAGVLFAMAYFGKHLGIPIQLDGGSLLGVLRHHGMQIPWTEDGDLLMVIDEVPAFTLDNYNQVMLSVNTSPHTTKLEQQLGHEFSVVLRNDTEWHKGMWFRLYVNKQHHFLDIFLWKKYPASHSVAWKTPSVMSIHAFQIEVPYSMMLPGKDCRFYNTILTKGCAQDAKGYITHAFGKHALGGPSKMDSGFDNNAVMKHLRKKQKDIKHFMFWESLWGCGVLCCLGAILVQFKQRNIAFDAKLYTKLVCFIVCLPFLPALAWVAYESRTAAYSFGVNYEKALLDLVGFGSYLSW